MSDKSNKYGYVGVDIPAQSFGSNKGVFNPAEINELVADNKWTSFGQLELIETQTVSTTTANIEFTDLGSYNVHLLVSSNFQPNVAGDGASLITRISNDGGSSYISTGYQEALQRNLANGTNSEVRSTNTSRFSRSAGATGSSTNENGEGYTYFYNLLNSSKYSFSTTHIVGFDSTPTFNIYFGGSVLPTAETHNAIQVFSSIGSISTLTAKLYGVKQL